MFFSVSGCVLNVFLLYVILNFDKLCIYTYVRSFYTRIIFFRRRIRIMTLSGEFLRSNMRKQSIIIAYCLSFLVIISSSYRPLLRPFKSSLNYNSNRFDFNTKMSQFDNDDNNNINQTNDDSAYNPYSNTPNDVYSYYSPSDALTKQPEPQSTITMKLPPPIFTDTQATADFCLGCKSYYKSIIKYFLLICSVFVRFLES